MKKIILFVTLFFCVINIQSQEKIYTLTEVDVAPKLFNYPLVDSLTTKQNFKKNLKRFIYRNLDIIKNNTKKVKVYVEFLINEEGAVSILRVKGSSIVGKLLAVKVISILQKMEPAQKNNVSVNMKYIVPITFNPAVYK